MTDRPAVLPAAAAALAALALSLPPGRSLIEQSMLWHMVVQMPLLVLAGWWAVGAAPARGWASPLGAWNRYGMTSLVASQAIAAYWMLPLAIDRAVVLPSADLQKLATLWVCGALLKHGLMRAPELIQLFFVGGTALMMGWLGTFFATTEQRLCNAYSLEGQAQAGGAFAALGLALGGAWLVGALRGRPQARVFTGKDSADRS